MYAYTKMAAVESPRTGSNYDFCGASRPGERQAVILERRTGRGHPTKGLIVVTEEAWRKLEWTRKGRLREAANRKHEGST